MIDDWTLADFRRHVPRIIAERDNARAAARKIADVVQMVIDQANRDHGRLTPSSILMLGTISKEARAALDGSGVTDYSHRCGECRSASACDSAVRCLGDGSGVSR